VADKTVRTNEFYKGVAGFLRMGGPDVRGSGRQKSPSGVHGQSPGGSLGAKPLEAKFKL